MSLFGGITNFLSGGKDKEAAALAAQAGAAFNGLSIPEIEAQKLYLEQLQQQGLLTPELEQSILQGDSAYAGISTDPRLKQAQLDALSSLRDVGSSGGMNMEDRARLSQVQSESGRAEKASRDAITQNMQSRGIGGSGFELAAQLSNQQGSAERAAQAGLEVNAQAQKRALEAMMQAGTLGGQMQSQDFSQQAQKANATDAISQFNAQNRTNAQARNVASQNSAQATNLSEKQRLSDQNAAMRNSQQQYNKELLQQKYENEYKKAAGQSGALANQAATTSAQGASNKAFVGGLISSGATAAASDKNAKKDIRELSSDDMSAFLDEITGYKYSYKNKKHGRGEQIGVMAQDIEKVAPEAVIEIDAVKHIDYDDPKLKNAQMAALANLHERLKKLEE